MPVRSVLGRACAAGVIGVVATAALAVPASAHVTVTSPDAQPGGRGTLVFRVPTESDTARTVKLTVTLPADHPFARVSAKVKPGWTSKAVETALPAPVQVGEVKISKAVSTVTWASSGQDIPPGMYDEFVLSVSPLPEGVDTLNFPVDQTYSDGKVVKWNEPVPASGAEPEQPAPQLKLVAASNDPAPAAASTDNSSDTLARLLGAAGLVLGLAALVLAIRSRAPQRSSSSQGSDPK